MARLDPSKTHESDWNDVTLMLAQRFNGAFSAQILVEAFDQGISIVESMTRHELDALIRSNVD